MLGFFWILLTEIEKQFQECSGIFFFFFFDNQVCYDRGDRSLWFTTTVKICSTIFFRHSIGRRPLGRGRKRLRIHHSFVASFCFANLRHFDEVISHTRYHRPLIMLIVGCLSAWNWNEECGSLLSPRLIIPGNWIFNRAALSNDS